MHQLLQEAVQRLLRRESLPASVMQECVGVMMRGDAAEIDIAAVLTAMAAKGPVPEELCGAASAMRSLATPITSRRTPLIDTCGTGGDRLHTFNISTASALVLAGAGLNVAKHGNRSVSSSSGSADVLESLGVNVNLSADAASECLDEIGLAFCFAPLFHGAMKHVAPVRRQLGFPTIFNLLGPLTNPASAEYQVIGTSSNQRAALIAAAMQNLQTTRTLVVCGNDELDEVSLWGETLVLEICGSDVTEHRWHAADFGLPECHVQVLQVSSAAESADVIRSILAGEQSPASRIVIANAAAGLIAAGRCGTPHEAAQQAAHALSSGAAKQVLEQLIAVTTRLASA
ncbi:MAG: anthranilate phosphoribosyltransferase [Planctomycetaceae bacterium]|nr:anthranilate phosphoribosyltransferase [Planctomycetaceae bacterium]